MSVCIEQVHYMFTTIHYEMCFFIPQAYEQAMTTDRSSPAHELGRDSSSSALGSTVNNLHHLHYP